MPDEKSTDVKPDSTPAVIPEKEEDSSGLSDFLASKPSPDEVEDDDDPPAGVAAKPEIEQDKPDKEPDKEPDKKADPDEADKDKTPVKADDKPSTDPVKPPDKDEGKKPEEKKPDEKPPETKPEEKLKVDYESDDNVYKKRFRDTSNWATNLNKQVVDQNREIAILKKKADGTYDEEIDNPPPDPEAIRTKAETDGRSIASREIAVAQFGEETVLKDLLKFREVFGQDIHMQGSVMAAEQPVIEAIKAVRRYEFFEEYGADPGAIMDKIKTKALAEYTDKMRETIREEERAKLAERIKTKDGEVTGLAKLTGKTDHKEAKKSLTSLDEILSE